jgi:hypothetical protein
MKVGNNWRGVHMEDVIKGRPFPTEDSLQGSYALPYTKISENKWKQIPIQLNGFRVLIEGDFIFNNVKWWLEQNVKITKKKV